MTPAKKQLVKLSLPSTFLATLPRFTAKSIADKKTSTTSTATNSKISSPTPETATNNAANFGTSINNNSKINSGAKELSTAGLTLNNVTNGSSTLDRSGRPAKKWHKERRQFKTFSGFKVSFLAYTNIAKGTGAKGKDKDAKAKDKDGKAKEKDAAKAKEKEVKIEVFSEVNSLASTPDIRSEA